MNDAGKSSTSPLYSETKKDKKGIFKKCKAMKEFHAYRGYGSTYNAEILNSFNPEILLKETKSAIINKLIDLLTELEGFEFVATLVLGFEKIE